MSRIDRNEESIDKREGVMSEEQIKLADKYLRFFRSTWMDKDNRGLFDKWEKADMYWEGDVNLPESDDDPGSNTNIVNCNTEGKVALQVEQNISVLADPYEPSEMPYSEEATIIGQFIIDKNHMRRKMDMHERRRDKFGMGIFTCLFNPDALDGMGIPEFKCWNPAYVFFDPNVTDYTEINQGRFAILIANKSRFWAEDTFDEERANIITPGYHPIESEYLFGEDEGQNDEISRDNYLHMYVFTKKKGKVRLVQMSGDGVILWDSEEHPEIKFPDGRYPIFLTPDMPREGTVWAKGSNELLWNSQDLINDLDDQIRINARLTGNIQKVVGTASGIDIDKWTNEAGLNIPAADPQAFQIVQPRAIPQYILERRNQALNYERQVQSRFSDQMNGVQQRGVDTATEALALQQSGLASIDHNKMLLQETLGEMLEYALELAKENWTEEQAFSISGKKNEFRWINPSRLKSIPRMIPASESYKEKFKNAQMEQSGGTLPEDYTDPEYMQSTEGVFDDQGNEITDESTGFKKTQPATKNAKFHMKVTVGAGIPNNKAFRYNVIKEAYRDRAITVQEYRKLLREYVALPVSDESEEQRTVRMLQAMAAMQKGAGQPGQMGQTGGAFADVQGLSASGYPNALSQQGGAAPNDYSTSQD